VSGSDCGAPEAEVRKGTLTRSKNGVPIKPDSITCVPK
jgi:hypothetical protein